MDRRTSSIVGVLIASVLCGLPGLAGLCFGPLVILGSLLPDSSVDPASTNLVIGIGIAILCLSVVFVATPIAIGILTLKGRKQKAIDFDEPIPKNDF